MQTNKPAKKARHELRNSSRNMTVNKTKAAFGLSVLKKAGNCVQRNLLLLLEFKYTQRNTLSLSKSSGLH